MTPPTPEHRALIDRATAVLVSDERILAAWLAGSFAAGTADRYSDVDLHLLVAEEHVARFRDELPGLMRAIIPDAVLVQHILGGSGALAVSPDWQQLDIAMHTSVAFEPSRPARLRELFDRSGIAWPARTPPQAEEPYFPNEAVHLYLYLLAKLAVVLGRGEVVLAVKGAVMRRDAGLVPLMLAANGVRKHDGSKRLNAYLTDEQRAVLEALPPLSAKRSAVLAFDRAVAVEVMSRGRALADRLGAEWPADLESATLRYLDRELGSAFLQPARTAIGRDLLE